MNRWERSINIKQHLSERTDREAVETAARGCLKELARISNKFGSDFAYLDIVDELQDIADCDDATCSDFNAVLDNLYYWADSRSVWLGL